MPSCETKFLGAPVVRFVLNVAINLLSSMAL